MFDKLSHFRSEEAVDGNTEWCKIIIIIIIINDNNINNNNGTKYYDECRIKIYNIIHL